MAVKPPATCIGEIVQIEPLTDKYCKPLKYDKYEQAIGIVTAIYTHTLEVQLIYHNGKPVFDVLDVHRQDAPLHVDDSDYRAESTYFGVYIDSENHHVYYAYDSDKVRAVRDKLDHILGSKGRIMLTLREMYKLRDSYSDDYLYLYIDDWYKDFK